jgi:hypothetical protein
VFYILSYDITLLKSVCLSVPSLKKILTRKSSGGHQAKKKKRRKKPKPEEQEGMPQHQHCPPEKRCGDKNPGCHEEQQKDVA